MIAYNKLYSIKKKIHFSSAIPLENCALWEHYQQLANNFIRDLKECTISGKKLINRKCELKTHLFNN